MRFLLFLLLIPLFLNASIKIKKDVADLDIDTTRSGWDIAIDRISLNLSSTSIQNQTNYEKFSNTHFKGDSQIVAESSLLFHSNYYAKHFVIFNTIFSEYGRNIIYPTDGKKIDNTTLDRIIISSDYTQKIWDFQHLWGGFDMGPYAQISYQTQFIKQSGFNRTQILRFNTGLKLFDGKYLKNFYISLFGEEDFTYKNPRQSFGFNTGINLQYNFNPNVKLVNYLNFKQYFLNNYPLQLSPELELEWNIRAESAIFKHFSIAPFFSFYLLKGKYFEKPATNIMLGISLIYGQTFIDSKAQKQEE
ncbi:hypothetical protein [Helicobacter anseris]|nr:hypothetical protein [Helicobacter anseris]